MSSAIIIVMVLGKHPKVYRHMMRNLVSSLILHERIETTAAKVLLPLARLSTCVRRGIS